jgi:beta-fructofuranosidase
MIYRPPEPYRLWDTWLYPWQGEYHLFHLQSEPGEAWGHIGHAVSTDLLHWKDCEPIATRGPEGAWDHGPTLTGMVVRHGGRFWMFYGAPHGGVQRIGLMVSDDLHLWRKFEGNPVLAPAGPHYQAEPGSPFAEADWRDPCVVWNEDAGLWDAYICARKATWDEDNTGACIAKAQSRDLIRWELLEPAAEVGAYFVNAEVPDYFRIEGRQYLLFSTTTASGGYLDTPERDRCSGTFYLSTEHGGRYFLMREHRMLIGAGSGRLDSYVGRTIQWGKRRLLYHHLAGPRPSWGLPKRIRRDQGGALFLEFWPEAAGLETGRAHEGFPAPAPVGMEMLGTWRPSGNTLSGHSGAAASAHVLSQQVADLHLTCEIEPQGCPRAGILLRVDPESRRGIAVVLDWDRGLVQVGRVEPSWAGGCTVTPLDSAGYGLRGRGAVKVRIFARAEFVEAYVGDFWLFSTVLPEEPLRGLLGFMVEGGRAAFKNLRCAELPPL